MAIYRLEAQIIGRKTGRDSRGAAAYRSGSKSVAASAAYRASDRLVGDAGGGPDGKQARVYDFRNKEGVVNSFIMAPDDAPAWARDRQSLWGSVERTEKRVDSQLARDFTLALPTELNDAEREALVRAWVQEQLVARGMIADVAIHRPSAHGDIRNEHAHVMTTLRRAFDDGFGNKERAWNSVHMLKEWRKTWQDHANQALSRAAIDERIDHRTLKKQRADALARKDFRAAELLDRKPQVHVGPKGDFVDRFVGDPPSKKRRSLYGREVDYSDYDQGSRRDHNERIIRGNLEKWANSQDPEIAQMARQEIDKRDRLSGELDAQKERERRQHAEMEELTKKRTEEAAELRRRFGLMAERYAAQAREAKEEEFRLKKEAQARRKALKRVRWLETPRGREMGAKGFYGAAWRELKHQQEQELARAKQSGDPNAVKNLVRLHKQAKSELYQKQQKDLRPGLLRRGVRWAADRLTAKARERRLDEEEAQIERDHVDKIRGWYARHKELKGMVDQIEKKRLDALFKNAQDSHAAEVELRTQHTLETAEANKAMGEIERVVDLDHERRKMELRRRAVQQEIEQERSSPDRRRERNDRN